MIKIIDDYYVINSGNTSYVMFKDKLGHLVHLYYGKRIDENKESLDSLRIKILNGIGNQIYENEENQDEVMEIIPQEISSFGKGDTRGCSVLIENNDLSRTNNFIVDKVYVGKPIKYNTLPTSKSVESVESLIVEMVDKVNSIRAILAYNAFDKENTITRQIIIKNESKGDIKVLKCSSLNLDMKNEEYFIRSFGGHWANEMNVYDREIVIGEYRNSVITGVSSNRCNPFFIVYKKGCSEDFGKVYGFNLIYSGNHEEVVEADTLGNVRIRHGINPNTFEYKLKSGEEFEAPEAVLSFSNDGFNGLSQNMHDYINNHIVDEEFRNFPRRVLNNSWEACYFNFNESKLLRMAKCAKRLGVELFVLDDGWFKGRNNDTTSLGDWIEDKKKLPHGLRGLGNKIRKLGLQFGIWVEPEMVSEKSDLFINHPDWVIKIDGKPHSLGRHQMILDLSNKLVEDYLFDSMCYVFNESKASYVKWDMNRNYSDYYSSNLDKERMQELNHRYYIGLYSLFKRLREKYPHVLIEGCASGGNRFDLGILSYCPQIWASDDTDPFYRMNAEYNYTYGYPLNTLGCHVASSPCLNTLRRSDLDTRFNVSYFGAFGYEIDLREETYKSKKIISEQIKYYKSIRNTLIGAKYYRVKKEDNKRAIEVLSKDKSLALITEVQLYYKPIHAYDKLNCYGLDDNKMYRVHCDDKLIGVKRLGGAINYISPIHIRDGGILQSIIDSVYKFKDKGLDIVSKGDALNNNGIIINESFAGSGINDKSRIMLDFDSRLYKIEAISE